MSYSFKAPFTEVSRSVGVTLLCSVEAGGNPPPRFCCNMLLGHSSEESEVASLTVGGVSHDTGTSSHVLGHSSSCADHPDNHQQFLDRPFRASLTWELAPSRPGCGPWPRRKGGPAFRVYGTPFLSGSTRARREAAFFSHSTSLPRSGSPLEARRSAGSLGQ